MPTLLQDLGYAWRMLRKNPGFTVVAVLTLALGIGANTAIFSLVNSVILKPLPYKDAERLVIIWEQNPHRGWYQNIVSMANFLDWRRQNHVFTDLAAIDPTSFNLAGGAGEPVEIGGERVTANLFSLLGVQPLRGRAFLSEEDKPGSAPVAVLNYGLWQRRYGGDPALIGKRISLDGESYTVVGVMPAGFSDVYTTYFAVNAQVWVSGLDLRPNGRTNHAYLALGRLKPGVSLAQAQAEMDAIARGIEQQDPENKGWGVELLSLHDQVVKYSRPALLVLLAAVALVLLIACANLTNLLLARAAGREREIALRTALGANRVRLIRQLLTENLLLAMLGGGLGIVLAAWGTTALVALTPPILLQMSPGLESAGISSRVLCYSLGLALTTGLLFGLLPAYGTSKTDLNESLKEGSRNCTESSRSHRVRGALVVTEFALAVALLVGAGLMIRTLAHLHQVDLGFNPDNVVTLRVPLRGPRYKEPARQVEFFQQLVARIEALPGVRSASVSRGLPMEGWAGMEFFTQENPNPPPGEQPDANYLVVSPHYFHTMGIPLRKGRAFTDADTRSSEQVVIVSEELARKHWPGQDAIGKRLRAGDEAELPWRTIVGIAGNVRTQGQDVRFVPELYIPLTQYPWALEPRDVVVRAASNPAGLTSAVRREIAALDKDQPVSDVRTLDHVAGEPVAQRQFLMVLLGVFAGLALALAAVGIYGVMTYSVAQRTHEIGIRMALGAEQRDVLKLIVARGLALAVVGVAAGLVAAFTLSRLMASLLYGVRPGDPATLAIVCLTLVAVALAASYIPARRATKVDPMVALRYE